MKLRDRLMLIAMGVVAITAGLAKAHQAGPFGHFDFRGQQVFPGSAIGSGILLLLFASLPSGSWIARLLKGKQKTGKH